ncbi:MAG: DNA-binding protein AraC-type [Paenibacillaceae bacterium]|nr:DNA-binding protein AraC-type [Paenibacillaceae bacterium]
MTNLESEEGFLIWVSQLWQLPPIEKMEDIGGSSMKIRRLQFVDGKIRFIKKMDSKDTSIQDVLLQRGVRIAELLQTEKGEPWADKNGELYVLSNELEGRVISELIPELGECYGQALAVLHKALKSIILKDHYKDMDLVQQLSKWAIPQTIEAAKRIGRREEMSNFADLMTSIGFPSFTQLPKQLIHRDPHPGNMLFADDGTIGFLDFDISVNGIRLFDLCYLCTSQWMTAFSDPKKQIIWLELIRQLRQGYEKVETLLEEERTSAFFVMCAIQMIFIAFWQDQNRADLTEMNLKALFDLIKNQSKIDNAFRLDEETSQMGVNTFLKG